MWRISTPSVISRCFIGRTATSLYAPASLLPMNVHNKTILCSAGAIRYKYNDPNQEKRAKKRLKKIVYPIPAFIGPRRLSKRIHVPLKKICARGQELFDWWPRMTAKQVVKEGFARIEDISMTYEEAVLLASQFGVRTEFEPLEDTDMLPGPTNIEKKIPAISIFGDERGLVEDLFQRFGSLYDSNRYNKGIQAFETIDNILITNIHAPKKPSTDEKYITLERPINRKQAGKFDPSVPIPTTAISLLKPPTHNCFRFMRRAAGHLSDMIIIIIRPEYEINDVFEEGINLAKEFDKQLIIITVGDNENKDLILIKTKIMNNQHNIDNYVFSPKEYVPNKIPIIHINDINNSDISQLINTISDICANNTTTIDTELVPEGQLIDAVAESRGRSKVLQMMITQGKLSIGDYFVSGLGRGKIKTISINIDNHDEIIQVKTLYPGILAEVVGNISLLPASEDDFKVASKDRVEAISDVRQRELLFEVRDELYPPLEALPRTVGYLRLPPARDSSAWAALNETHTQIHRLALAEFSADEQVEAIDDVNDDELFDLEGDSYIMPSFENYEYDQEYAKPRIIDNNTIKDIKPPRISIVFKTRTAGLMRIVYDEINNINNNIIDQWPADYDVKMAPQIEIIGSTAGRVGKMDVVRAACGGTNHGVIFNIGITTADKKMKQYMLSRNVKAYNFKKIEDVLLVLNSQIGNYLDHLK